MASVEKCRDIPNTRGKRKKKIKQIFLSKLKIKGVKREREREREREENENFTTNIR